MRSESNGRKPCTEHEAYRLVGKQHVVKAYDSRRQRKEFCKCREVLVELQYTVRIVEIDIVRMHCYEQYGRHYGIVKYLSGFERVRQRYHKAHKEQIVSVEKKFALVRREAEASYGKSSYRIELLSVKRSQTVFGLDVILLVLRPELFLVTLLEFGKLEVYLLGSVRCNVLFMSGSLVESAVSGCGEIDVKRLDVIGILAFEALDRIRKTDIDITLCSELSELFLKLGCRLAALVYLEEIGISRVIEIKSGCLKEIFESLDSAESLGADPVDDGGICA